MGNSHLGERCFKPLLDGKPAQYLGQPHQPHTFTYVPDFARALRSVAALPAAWGQVWHVPNAPAMSFSEILGLLEQLLGRRVRVQALPFWVQDILALGMPLMREITEMRFQWDRPYLVDHAKFAAQFWGDFTPLAEGLRTTLEWYRVQAADQPSR